MLAAMRRIFDSVGYYFNILFPQRCPICSAQIKAFSRGSICPGCWAKAKYVRPPFCAKCGRPLRLQFDLAETPDYLCGDCRRRTLYFHKARGAFEYEGVVREAIHLFKYKKIIGIAREMSLFSANHFGVLFPDERFDLMVNVPLHRKRLMDREFDQAWAVAKELGNILSIEARNDLMSRIEATPPQTSMAREDRLKNVKGAFAAIKPEVIEGKNLLLVDDVMTTGATVNECAKTLLKAGAAQVSAFTLARSAQD